MDKRIACTLRYRRQAEKCAVMKRWFATFALFLSAAGVAVGQSPAMADFMDRLGVISQRLTLADNAEDYAVVEGLYMEMACLYTMQTPQVRDEVRPMMKDVWYNIACMRALQGNAEGAADAFANAVSFGWRDYDFTVADPDLESVIDDARFRALLDGMR